jgi:hypothetical protein
MPLLAMSPNIQDPESPSRKRSHEDFMDGTPSGFDAVSGKPFPRSDVENIPLRELLAWKIEKEKIYSGLY